MKNAILHMVPPGIASGEISIYRLTNGVQSLIETRSNAILPNYKYLLSRLLIKDNTADLGMIRLYSGATLVYAGPINVYAYSGVNEANFQATFDEASFAGAFDRATLGPVDGAMGIFSEVTGLDQNKTNAEVIQVSWKIKFN